MPSQLFTHINLEIRLRNQIQRNTHPPVGSIVKNHVVAVQAQQTSAKVALAVNRLPRLHLRVTPGEAFEVGPFVQAPFESW